MERLDNRVFIATTETIRAARRFVREHSEAATIDSRTLADVELATSELVSNAIEHGSGDDYQILIATTVDRIVIEVASGRNGGTHDMPAEWTTSDPEMPSGRGLALVMAVSDNAWVEHTGDRMIVGCDFNIPNTGKMPPL